MQHSRTSMAQAVLAATNTLSPDVEAITTTYVQHVRTLDTEISRLRDELSAVQAASIEKETAAAELAELQTRRCSSLAKDLVAAMRRADEAERCCAALSAQLSLASKSNAPPLPSRAALSTPFGDAGGGPGVAAPDLSLSTQIPPPSPSYSYDGVTAASLSERSDRSAATASTSLHRPGDRSSVPSVRRALYNSSTEQDTSLSSAACAPASRDVLLQLPDVSALLGCIAEAERRLDSLADDLDASAAALAELRAAASAGGTAREPAEAVGLPTKAPPTPLSVSPPRIPPPYRLQWEETGLESPVTAPHRLNRSVYQSVTPAVRVSVSRSTEVPPAHPLLGLGEPSTGVPGTPTPAGVDTEDVDTEDVATVRTAETTPHVSNLSVAEHLDSPSRAEAVSSLAALQEAISSAVSRTDARPSGVEGAMGELEEMHRINRAQQQQMVLLRQALTASRLREQQLTEQLDLAARALHSSAEVTRTNAASRKAQFAALSVAMAPGRNALMSCLSTSKSGA